MSRSSPPPFPRFLSKQHITHQSFLNLQQKSSLSKQHEAKYNLAYHFENGQTQLEKNRIQAKRLYKELLKVEQWRAKAAFRLSKMAQQNRSEKERRKWLHKAKEYGSSEALWELTKITTNAIRKRALLENASSLNDTRAMIELAELNSKAVGVTMNDLDHASDLLDESVRNGASEKEVRKHREKLEKKKLETWEDEKKKRSFLDAIHHLQTQDPWEKSKQTAKEIVQNAQNYLDTCHIHMSDREFDSLSKYFPRIHSSAETSLFFNRKLIQVCLKHNLYYQFIKLLESIRKHCGDEALQTLELPKCLQQALRNNQHEIVEYLLNPFTGLNPRIEAKFGIFWASYNNQVKLLKVLLRDKRLDPSAGGNKAIICACEMGHETVVSELLSDRRVDPGQSHSYALRIASKKGYANIVRLLLEHENTNPIYTAEYKEVTGRGALQWAAEYGHTEVVRLLLEDVRAPAPAEDQHAIRMAAKNGHVSICHLLLSLRRRVDPSSHHQFALCEAVRRNHHKVVEVLLSSEGVDRVDPKQCVDVTVHNWQVYKSCCEHASLAMLKLLLQFKVPPPEILSEMETILGRRVDFVQREILPYMDPNESDEISSNEEQEEDETATEESSDDGSEEGYVTEEESVESEEDAPRKQNVNQRDSVAPSQNQVSIFEESEASMSELLQRWYQNHSALEQYSHQQQDVSEISSMFTDEEDHESISGTLEREEYAKDVLEMSRYFGEFCDTLS